MKKRYLTKIGFILVGIGLFNSSLFGFNYKKDDPLFFTYQNSRGYWFGCGVTQCLQTGQKSESKATSYLMNRNKFGSFNQSSYVAHWGRCTVYKGRGKTDRGDWNRADKIVRLMYKKCK